MNRGQKQIVSLLLFSLLAASPHYMSGALKKCTRIVVPHVKKSITKLYGGKPPLQPISSLSGVQPFRYSFQRKFQHGLFSTLLSCVALSLLQRNARAEDQDDLLRKAIKKNDTEAVKRLLQAGASHALHDKEGNTPLHWAISHESPEDLGIVKLLLEAGADKNARNKDGITPLYLAAKNGYAPLVDLLLKAGATTDARAHDGSRPRDVAVRNGHQAVVDLLIKADADKDFVDKPYVRTTPYCSRERQDELC